MGLLVHFSSVSRSASALQEIAVIGDSSLAELHLGKKNMLQHSSVNWNHGQTCGTYCVHMYNYADYALAKLQLI